MGPEETGVAIGMLALVVGSGMVSGSEAAFFSLDEPQLDELRRGDRLGRLVSTLRERASRLLLVILIANNIINIAYFVLASWWAGRYQDTPATAAGIAFGALAALIFCGEIMPKILAAKQAVTFARRLSPALWVLSVITAPLCRVVELLLGRGIDEERVGIGVTADELKLVIEHSRDHGVVSPLVHDRLIEIVDLSSTPAAAAMTHRVDCTGIRVTASHHDAVEMLRARPAPIILVYDDEDNAVGLLTAQALLKGGRPAKRMVKPLFIPEGAQLAQVLQLFKEARRSAGVVVDEYGGTLGLLTLAHVTDELLGPGASPDQADRPEPEQLDATRWRLPGLLALEAWAPLIDPADRAGCTTIGGFVTKMLGAVPQTGDSLLYNNLLFKVESVEGRRIRVISVEKLPLAKARRLTQQKAVR